MTDVAIVDSGYVHALIDSDDRHHAKAWTLLKQSRWNFRVPPVIFVEVFHTRMRDAIAKDRQVYITQQFAKALRWLVGDEVPFQLEDMALSDYRRVAELLDQYADSRIEYVDAVVIATAERFGTQYVMTTDKEDFRRYVPNFAPHFILPIFDL